jgi:hypothetical protein
MGRDFDWCRAARKPLVEASIPSLDLAAARDQSPLVWFPPPAASLRPGAVFVGPMK